MFIDKLVIKELTGMDKNLVTFAFGVNVKFSVDNLLEKVVILVCRATASPTNKSITIRKNGSFMLGIAPFLVFHIR